MDFELFRRKPLLGIVRGITLEQVDSVVESAIAGGLETLEITMNTAHAPKLIERAVASARGRMAIGAGTVLNRADLDSALGAGATFVVSPMRVDDVVATCVAREIPVFPGALTPQEIHEAWNAGASMVKVFPAKFFGPAYFREIKGPFDRVLLLACGGVSAATLPDFARCGADAFAVGGSVFDPARIQEGRFGEIEADIRSLVTALP